MINAILGLLGCQLAGEALVRATGTPVPGPVVGLVLLLGLLGVLRRVPGQLEPVANGLLAHLSLLFVPAGVGVMAHAGRIQADWLPIAVALVASTILTIAVTALVFRLVDRRGETGPEDTAATPSGAPQATGKPEGGPEP